MHAPSRRKTLRDVRILVVEDDPDSLEVLRTLLEGAGAVVTAATSAREALEALEDRGVFDVMVSDLGLPAMDGYTLNGRIRALDRGSDLPAVALTAYARSEDAERARRAGYQEHLAKPVEEGRLVEAVSTWSRRSSPGVPS